IPLFPLEFNVIALDLLGCGDSDKPLEVSYSLKQHALLVKEFTDVLGIDKFHLVGHDVGGGIAQIFAVNNPDQLHSLTLLNSVGYDFWPVQPIIAMRTPIIRQFAMATLDLGTFKLIVRRGLFHKENLTEELMEHFWYPMKSREGRKAFLHFAKCLDNKNLLDIESALTKLDIPTLIIRGDADPYLSENIAHRLNAGIPSSKLVLMEKGSHFIQEDLPEDIVNAITDLVLA
nr:alpha/beta hydrolase [FCB group bacterium]